MVSSHFRFALTLLLLVGLGFSNIAPVTGQDRVLTQNQLLTTPVFGNLTITNGARVIVRNTRIEGSVQVSEGATLYVQGVRIDGDLRAKLPEHITLKVHEGRRTRILGDVKIENSLGGKLRFFDTLFEGQVLVQDNVTEDIVFHDNILLQDLQLFGNTADRTIAVMNNLIFGNLQLDDNLPEPIVKGNWIQAGVADGSMVTLTVAGNEGSEEFELQLDGISVRRWRATRDMEKYRYRASQQIRPEQVRVLFTNDLFTETTDRNLIVDSLAIDEQVFETEATDVYSTGTYIGGQGIVPGFWQQETLHTNGYFQYAAQTQTAPTPDLANRLNQILPDEWSWDLVNDGEHLRILIFNDAGGVLFAVRFGAAGVISEYQDARSGEALLANTFQGEVTDRVMQWTMWELGKTVVNDVVFLPPFEDRFNMTQAGTFNNVLHGVADVRLDSTGGQLEVWAVIDRNWKSEQDPHMQAVMPALTRYRVLDNGAILVRRIIRIGEIRLNGELVEMENPLIEAWTPFFVKNLNSVALQLDDNGVPLNPLHASFNLPAYPQWPVSTTRGWALAYNRLQLGSSNLSVVFGQQKGQIHLADGTQIPAAKFNLNTMDFPGGMAVLPGFQPGQIPAGSLVDQYYLFLPGIGLATGTGPMLDKLAAEIPPPQVYHPGTTLPAELEVIRTRLQGLPAEPRVRTDRLGTVSAEAE